MIGKALDRYVPPANADNTFDDTDVDVFLIEECALLDMQFNERQRFAGLSLRKIETVGIATDVAIPKALDTSTRCSRLSVTRS